MGIGALSYKIFKIKKPLNVMFAVTNRCNSSCIYCSIPQREQEDLSFDKIVFILKQLRNAGTVRLGLWGGEPLLREDIGEIIDYAKDLGFYTTLDTNAHLLPEKFKQIRRIDHIVIGFDGPEEIHDFQRGKGCFKKVIEAFKILKNTNIPVWTITVLTKYNLDCIEEILFYAQKYNFKTTFQVLHHNEFLAKDYKDLIPSDIKLRQCIQKIISYKERKYPIASSFSYLRYLLNWPHYEKTISQERIGNLKCLAGKLYCNIDVTGEIYPCSLLIQKFPAKNIFKEGFKQAFSSLDSYNCKSCLASCFVEYNYLFSLHLNTIWQWLRAMPKK